MKEFKVSNKVYTLPESFAEMKLGTFLRVMEVQEGLSENLFKELYLIRLLEACVGAEQGDLDELSIEEMTHLIGKLDYLNDLAKGNEIKSLYLDGVKYMFPLNLNKLTMGEYISIKTLTEGKSSAETIINLLAIILRPAVKKVDDSGVERWEQKKFDVEGIEFRKREFLKLPVLDVLWNIHFFLTGGKEDSEKILLDYGMPG